MVFISCHCLVMTFYFFIILLLYFIYVRTIQTSKTYSIRHTEITNRIMDANMLQNRSNMYSNYYNVIKFIGFESDTV